MKNYSIRESNLVNPDATGVLIGPRRGSSLKKWAEIYIPAGWDRSVVCPRPLIAVEFDMNIHNTRTKWGV
jgi:hypothetical protein